MNKRLLLLCLGLSLLPCVVGCDEKAKANNANTPDEKAKADEDAAALP